MDFITTANDVATYAAQILPRAEVPDPGAEQPPGTEGISTILGWLKWGGLSVCIAGLMIAGALMAIKSQRGDGGDTTGRIGMALVGVIIISAGASLVGFLAG